MVDAQFLNTFLDQHGLEIVIGGGALIGFLILWKKLRKVNTQPDFIKIFKEQNIRDESLNETGRFDVKWLYRGEEKLGRILDLDTQKINYTPTKQEFDTKAGIQGWESDITTIVFRPKNAVLNLWLGEKRILRFKPDEARVEGRKLVFPSSMGFTALGGEYITKTSFKEISTVIESDWNKRLFEANVNVMASKMSHISAETPEMAHELSMKRLEIDKIRADKQAKVGGLI